MLTIPDIVVLLSLLKPDLSPTNRYSTLFINHCDIVFIYQV